MSILGHAAGAAGAGSASAAAAAGPMASLAAASAGGLASDSLGAAAGGHHHSETAFDSYLSKLQTICTDNGMDTSGSGSAGGLHGHHSGSGGHHDPMGTSSSGLMGGAVGPSGGPGSMKSALQNFNSLSSRI